MRTCAGLVYAGPGLVRRINGASLAETERLGVRTLVQLRQALAGARTCGAANCRHGARCGGFHA